MHGRTKMGYIIFGMLAMLILNSTLLPAIASTTARRQQITVTYDDIKVVVNGVLLERDGAGNPIREPFMLDGVTMVPARVIGEQLAGGVTSWDADTRTLYIGPRAEARPQAAPFTRAVPFYDSGSNVWNSAIQNQDSVSMGATQYLNAIVFRHDIYTTATSFTLHNLNNNYSHLSGYLGRVDGSSMRDATFNFYGDGNLLASYSISAQDLPRMITVYVAGIRQLKIECIHNSSYAFAGAVIE